MKRGYQITGGPGRQHYKPGPTISVAKWAIILFCFLAAAMASAQNNELPEQDLTEILGSLQTTITIGNPCGEPYFIDANVYGGLEFNQLYMDLMYSQITVHGNLTNNGEILTLEEAENLGFITYLCDQANVIIINETLGTPDLERQEITITPNPATDYLRLKGNNIKHVAAYNMTGQLVLDINQPGTDHEIRLYNYKPGMYLFKIWTTDGASITKKIIIK